jgi:anti-anti-sigma factor
MDGTGLTIERRVSPTVVWFGVAGDLDLDSVGTMSTVLWTEIDGHGGDVAIDLAGIDVIGFAGVELLATVARQLASDGRHLRICATNPVVERTFTLAAPGLRDTLVR